MLVYPRGYKLKVYSLLGPFHICRDTKDFIGLSEQEKTHDTLLCGFYTAQTYCTSNEQKVAILVHVSPHYHGYCRSDRGRFTLGSSGTADFLLANASPATC